MKFKIPINKYSIFKPISHLSRNLSILLNRNIAISTYIKKGIFSCAASILNYGPSEGQTVLQPRLFAVFINPTAAMTLTHSSSSSIGFSTLRSVRIVATLNIDNKMQDHTYSKLNEQATPSTKRKRRRTLDTDRSRSSNKKRVNIGASFQRWKHLMQQRGITRNAEFAALLLDK